jgi:hypothetical protein
LTEKPWVWGQGSDMSLRTTCIRGKRRFTRERVSHFSRPILFCLDYLWRVELVCSGGWVWESGS